MKKTTAQKLKSLFDWKAGNDGIFYYLQQIATLPWKNSNINAVLDLEYYGNHSGNKDISPLVESLLSERSELSATDKAILANTIFAIYGDKWIADYNVLHAEYDPIENYSSTETEDIDTNNIETPHNWKVTETQTPTEWKQTTTGSDTDNNQTVESEIYGFNSASSEPERKQTTSVNSNISTEQSGSFQTDTETTGTYDRDNYVHRHMTRSGNIGVTTSQQMIESELKLREWSFYHAVMRDIDDILTLKIY